MFAQIEESPYEPCNLSEALNPLCSLGVRTCSEEQLPCSVGYCFDTPPITPNAGIPVSGIVTNKVIEINGNYRITVGAVFTYCTFRMHAGSTITIAPSAGSKKEVTFEQCEFFSCDSLWNGIVIDVGSVNFIFNLKLSTIEDAYIGIKLDEGANVVYNIAGNSFINNYIGIGNKQQSNLFLNAIITSNDFYTTDVLRPAPFSMKALGLSFTGYPYARAGIEYINTSSVVGVTGTGNQFSCLIHGIIAKNCSLASHDNSFFDLRSNGYGIKALDGSLLATTNAFTNAGQCAIYADGVILRATTNLFWGTMQYGIYSFNNLSGENIVINSLNEFNMDSDTWINGVYLERTQATTSTHNQISNNHFYISDCTGFAAGIQYADLVTATDACKIENNYFEVQSSVNVHVDCINLEIGMSDNVNVLNNTIVNLRTNIVPRGFGIVALAGMGYDGSSTGHLIKHNNVTGTALTSMICCFHTYGMENLEFCDNTADYSQKGFHFMDLNDIILRENKINRHALGIHINDIAMTGNPVIGNQDGRGNTWSGTVNDDCTIYAIVNENTNPFLSGFLVPEGSTLPFLPSSAEIDPDPSVSMQDWFKYNPLTAIDYCEDPEPMELRLTPFETPVVAGTSTITGVQLWDLKRNIYSKMLLNPALRPSGSPEEAFFNSFSGTSIEAFGEIGSIVSAGFFLSSEDATVLDDAENTIQQYLEDIIEADAVIDFLSLSNLTDDWCEARANSLQNIQSALDDINAIKNVRAIQIGAALQDAIETNNSITTGNSYEEARLMVNGFRLRRMAGEPLTQSEYEDILTLAQQNMGSQGQAVLEAISFLAPCDRIVPEEEVEERDQHHYDDQANKPLDKAIHILPNPSAGSLQVILPEKSEGLLFVYDYTGKKIKEIKIVAEMEGYILDLSGCSSGMYRVTFLDFDNKIYLPAVALTLMR